MADSPGPFKIVTICETLPQRPTRAAAEPNPPPLPSLSLQDGPAQRDTNKHQRIAPPVHRRGSASPLHWLLAGQQ